MALGADDMQAARRQHRVVAFFPGGFDGFNLLFGRRFQQRHFGLPAAAQHDIGTTARHVGGDGHRAALAGLCDDIRFHGVELGVQHLVVDARFGQFAGNHFGFLDRDGTHQHRLAFGGTLADVFDDGADLLFLGHVHQIRHVLTDHRTVGWHHDGVQLVDRAEFEGFGIGGTGHPRQLLVQAEVVLEGDRCQRLVLVLDLHAFFGFHRLVQAVGPTAPLHGTAGVFVDDDHFAIFHDVVNVAGEQHVGAQRGGNVVHQHDVGRRVQRLALIHDAGFHQHLFDQDQAAFGQVNLARLLIHREVPFTLEGVGVFFFLADQFRDQLVDLDVHLGAVFGRAGDDQRRTRFIDQDGVHLIHQRIVQFALHALFRAERHVVAQVVEAVFVVGAVGDVGGVSFTLGRRRHARQVDTDAQAEELEQRTVVFGVTLRQIVVDGHDVHAAAAQGVQVGRQRRGQGFTFTGAHLGDAAVIQHHAAQQLHVEVTHAEHAFTRLTHYGEGFRDQAFQRFALLQARAEFVGFRFQLIIGQFFHVRFHAVDLLNHFAHAAQGTIVTAAKNFG